MRTVFVEMPVSNKESDARSVHTSGCSFSGELWYESGFPSHKIDRKNCVNFFGNAGALQNSNKEPSFGQLESSRRTSLNRARKKLLFLHSCVYITWERLQLWSRRENGIIISPVCSKASGLEESSSFSNRFFGIFWDSFLRFPCRPTFILPKSCIVFRKLRIGCRSTETSFCPAVSARTEIFVTWG